MRPRFLRKLHLEDVREMHVLPEGLERCKAQHLTRCDTLLKSMQQPVYIRLVRRYHGRLACWHQTLSMEPSVQSSQKIRAACAPFEECSYCKRVSRHQRCILDNQQVQRLVTPCWARILHPCFRRGKPACRICTSEPHANSTHHEVILRVANPATNSETLWQPWVHSMTQLRGRASH